MILQRTKNLKRRCLDNFLPQPPIYHFGDKQKVIEESGGILHPPGINY